MKNIVFILLILVAAVAILGVVAPRRFELRRDVTVAKPNRVVFAYLRSLKNQKDWNSFIKKDPLMKLEFVGADGAVGSKMQFAGNEQAGTGETELTKIVEGEWVESEIRMAKPFKAEFTSFMTTEPVDRRHTKVTMGMVDEMEFPMNVICLIMNPKKQLKKDFDQSLADIKAALEK